jgi:hypothetical protein
MLREREAQVRMQRTLEARERAAGHVLNFSASRANCVVVVVDRAEQVRCFSVRLRLRRGCADRVKRLQRAIYRCKTDSRAFSLRSGARRQTPR